MNIEQTVHPLEIQRPKVLMACMNLVAVVLCFILSVISAILMIAETGDREDEWKGKEVETNLSI